MAGVNPNGGRLAFAPVQAWTPTFWNGSKIFVLVRGGIAVHGLAGVHGVTGVHGMTGKGRAVRPGAASGLLEAHCAQHRPRAEKQTAYPCRDCGAHARVHGAPANRRFPLLAPAWPVLVAGCGRTACRERRVNFRWPGCPEQPGVCGGGLVRAGIAATHSPSGPVCLLAAPVRGIG
jgi:hypothetical protein